MTLEDKTTDTLADRIPVHNINMDISLGDQGYVEEIMYKEIEGLEILHKAFNREGSYDLSFKRDHATFLFILKGSGMLNTEVGQQVLDESSFVLLPNEITQADIHLVEGQSIHFLEFSKTYSDEDLKYLRLKDGRLDHIYYRRFQDCEPYTEKIKSPNTISRTILPGGIIPRVALGMVEASGPDRVGEHSHPMLEQLFLGLSDNEITVYADRSEASMKSYSLLHIPLGSTHWVEVENDRKMNYLWMDFFLTKEGEVWLETHKPIQENNTNNKNT